MRIALVVDHPQRDLPGLVLLAGRLCEAGATCYLVPLDLQTRELTALAPDLVLLNYLRRNNQALAAGLLRAGIRIGVLDTEGGIMEGPEVYERTLATDAAVRERVSVLCTWGTRLAAEAARRGWYPADRVRVTGSPRFDFYADPWRRVPASRPCGADRIPAPRVLLTTSYSFLNPRFGSLDEEIRGLEALGYDPGFLRHRVEIEREGLDRFSELAGRLASRFPEASFVLRPHPFEDAATYARALAAGPARPNLHLDQSGTLDVWLVHCRALVQSSCTSAVEAALAGLPVLTPAWIPTWRRVEVLDRVSHGCPDEGEMERRIADILTGSGASDRLRPPGAEAALRAWFFEIDGRAHRRVADAVIESLETGNVRPQPTRSRRLHYRLDDERLTDCGRVSARVKSLLDLPASWSFRRLRLASPQERWDSSAKAFGPQDVRSLVESIASACPSGDFWERAPGELRVRRAERRLDYVLNLAGARSTVLSPG